MKLTFRIMLRGDWQIQFENEQGWISLISPSWVSLDTWEIYSKEALFTDVERFGKLEDALKQISKYLQENVKESEIPINWALAFYTEKA